MEIEDLRKAGKLPKNFVEKPGTVIFIDVKGEPWFCENGDGTVSGFPAERIYLHKKKRKK